MIELRASESRAGLTARHRRQNIRLLAGGDFGKPMQTCFRLIGTERSLAAM
jgi:hypothetical protein